MTSEAIERREQGDALSQVLGTGNTKAMLAQVEENVKAVIDVARDRGFVRRYGESNQEFYGEPAWSLLGLTYGLVGFVEWTRKVDNGWEARAVARTRDGVDVAAAEAMCTRTEGNRRNAPEHTLRAMAQTRARRNALRSALGAALVLAGFDFPDPEAPATDEQVGLLHLLERETGLSAEEGHAQAGVESYRDLTREQASELIQVWQGVALLRQASDSSTKSDEARNVPSTTGMVAGESPARASGTLGAETPVVEDSRAGGEATAAMHGPSSTEGASPEEPPPVLDQQRGGQNADEQESAGSDEHPRVHPGEGGIEDRRTGGDGGSPEAGGGVVGSAPASPADWEQASKAGLTAGRALARARKRHRDKDPLFPNIVARASDLTEAQLQALWE